MPKIHNLSDGDHEGPSRKRLKANESDDSDNTSDLSQNPGFLNDVRCNLYFCNIADITSLFVNSEQTEHCSEIRSKKQNIKQMSICSSLLST